MLKDEEEVKQKEDTEERLPIYHLTCGNKSYCGLDATDWVTVDLKDHVPCKCCLKAKMDT